MRNKEDWSFTIGYDGPAAVVDGQAKRKYGKLGALELAKKGLYRAAWAAAIYDGGDGREVLDEYMSVAAKNGLPVERPADPGRLFGAAMNDAAKGVERSLIF
jgi:hypothetical protein